MKKGIRFYLIILLISLLVGCTSSFSFNYENLKNEVTKVEIIRLSDYEGTLYPDMDKNYVILITLVDEEKDKLLLELSKIEFTHFYGSPNYSPKDLCLKLYYNDGTYGFINQNTSFRFNEDGSKYVTSQSVSTSEDSFINLILQFIELE